MSIVTFTPIQQPIYILNLEQQSPTPFLVNLENVQLQSLNQGFAPQQPQFIGTVNLMNLAPKEPQQPEDLFLKHELQNLKAGKSNDYFRSKDYLAMSASDKQNSIWEEIMRTSSESSSFPNTIKLGKIFVEQMEKTFSTKGDTMPDQFLGQREKLIHSVGTHGKVVFETNGKHKYTGIFQGAHHGIVRFSSAVKPGGSDPLTPGMGLKFLRDGIDSAHLVAMNSVDGQKSWNFFENSFTTEIGDAKSAKIKLLVAKFATATKFAFSMGLSDMAKYDESGNTDPDEVFPHMLTFEPHPDVAHLFPSDLGGQDPMIYVQQLESVPENAVLYNVFAKETPETSGKGEQIGTLRLDGHMTKSSWGDHNLFFRHQKYDDDLKIHPEWTSQIPKWKACPFLSNLL